MTAIEVLVLESVHRLTEADADKIRSCVRELTGKPVSRERISEVLQNLMNREMLSSQESDERAVKKVYELGQDGKLYFSAS